MIPLFPITQPGGNVIRERTPPPTTVTTTTVADLLNNV
ncbi:hypothetical protein CAEBREN_28695 [Caenorhabditis brenneri]|uniref:Uncharacterized protein n=1 Tax=Caenorhabditis brenneri TaxID=135651 RepID=G0NNY0_CAEBE|nr:hypothetical protein CAEBREN_28695 [Caenorhabditis brenneri]